MMMHQWRGVTRDCNKKAHCDKAVLEEKLKGASTQTCRLGFPEVHKERQNLHVFLVKLVDICRKINLFSLFVLYAYNLVHILLQLGTYHAHYTNLEN